jgi:cell division inhibitor SepF
MRNMTGTPKDDPESYIFDGNDEGEGVAGPSDVGDLLNAGSEVDSMKQDESPRNEYIFPVIRTPEAFEDAKKIADDIKANKYVVINVEKLDQETAREVLDFVAGAMCIKGAKHKKINQNAFLVVPGNTNVESDGEDSDILDA